MADRYWVGGSGTWNTTNTANWSDAPGGTSGASVPTLADDVYFDSASSSGDYTVTTSGSAVARSASFAGPSTGTLTVAGTATIALYGGLTIAATGVTWNHASQFNFVATDGEWTINTNGKTLGTVAFNAGSNNVRTSWVLGGALTTAGSLTISNGVLVTNNYAVTTNASGMNWNGGFCINGTTTFTLVGTWTRNSGGTSFTHAPDVSFVQNGTAAGGTTCSSNWFQFGRVNISGTAGASTFTASGYFVVGRFTSTKTSAYTIQLPTSTAGPYVGSWEITGTVGNVVTVNGNPGYPLQLGKQTSGINYLNCVGVSVGNANSGCAEFYIGPNSVNNIGSGKIYVSNPPAPVTRYWVGGTGTWNTTSTTNWSDTSGGAGGFSVPTSVDTVVFDAASSAGSYTVTRSGNTLVSGNVTYGAPASGTLTIGNSGTGMHFGSVTVASTGVSGFTGANITAAFGQTNTLTLPPAAVNLYMNGSGVFSLATATTGFTVLFPYLSPGATLRTNGYAVSVSYIESSLSGYLVLDAATTTFTHTSNTASGGFWLTGSVGTFQNSNGTPALSSSPALDIGTLRTTSTGATPIFFHGGSAPLVATPNLRLGFSCGTFSLASPTGPQFATVLCPIKVSTAFNVSGSDGFRRYMFSPIPAVTTSGSANTVYAGVNAILQLNGTATLVDVDFWGVTVTGSAAPVSGTRLGDAGFNSGITFDAPKTVYWNGGVQTNLATISWAATDGGTASASNYPLPQDTAVFTNTSPSSGNSLSAGSNSVWLPAFNLAARTNAITFSSTGSVTRFFGDVTLSSAVSAFFTGTSVMFCKNGTQNIELAGKMLSLAGVASYSGTAVLASNSTISSFRYDNGNFDLNSKVLTISGAFYSSGFSASPYTFAFGTGSITFTGTYFQLLGDVATTLTVTGSRTVNVSRTTGSVTWASTAMDWNALDVNLPSGTFTWTDSGGGAAYRNLNLTGFAGNLANATRGLYGSLTLGSTATLSAGTSATTFRPPVATTSTLVAGGRTVDFPVVVNGAGTFQLSDALTLAATRVFTLTAGTLDLNGFTLTVAVFNSSNSNIRSIAFGSQQIALTGNAATIWDNSGATNFSYTGTFKVVATYAGATGTRTLAQGGTEATVQPISTAGGAGFILDTTSTDIKTLTGSWGDIDLTGVTGTYTEGVATCFGNFNAGSTATIASSSSALTFASTSGTKTITTNGQTLNFPLTFGGIGGRWQLQDSLTSGTTRQLSLTAGTLDLNGYTLTTGLFYSSASSIWQVRALAFGSGNITLTGSGTVWNTLNASALVDFSRTGTPTVNVANNSATATTISTGPMTEGKALDFNFTTGTYTLTDTSAVYRSVNLTGFGGTFANNARTYYGSLNVGSTATMTAGANAQTFAATSGTWSITTNGRTLDFPLTFNGAGGTWQLADALTVGSTRAFTLTAGTFDANIYNVTIGTMSSSNSNVRTLALGSGTWTVSGSGASAWTFSTSTNATVTGTATISMTSASAKTFAGGGLAWPTLNQGGSGALTILGSNTFGTLSKSVAPCTITFGAGTTQTVSTLNVSGTSGSITTINSSTVGTRATLNLIGGDVTLSYVSLKDNSATGGYSYSAKLLDGNVNAGNNLGWNFGLATGNFLSFF
jgi:hypothetical protein